MFDINLKHSLATVAVAAGLLAAAGPASAGTHDADVIAYNGHAGLGASVYQHNQTDLEFLALSPQGPGSEGFWLGSNDALAAVSRTGPRTRSCSESAPRPRGISRSTSGPLRGSPQTVSGRTRSRSWTGVGGLPGEAGGCCVACPAGLARRTVVADNGRGSRPRVGFDWAPEWIQCPITRATFAICGYRVASGGCLNSALRLASGLLIRRLLFLHTREVADS